MKTTGRFILYLLILYVAGSALYYYGLKPLSDGLPPPLQASTKASPVGIYVHVFAAVLALLLGPLQFWQGLRQRRPKLHRWMGRAYLAFGILIGGISGLYLSVYASGGMVGKLGFAMLAAGWLYTGTMAYRSIRAGDVAAHRAWMFRNFALTLAAVTFRIYLPLAMMAGFEFQVVYAIDAWMCWVPNLVLAELLLKRRAHIVSRPLQTVIRPT